MPDVGGFFTDGKFMFVPEVATHIIDLIAIMSDLVMGFALAHMIISGPTSARHTDLDRAQAVSLLHQCTEASSSWIATCNPRLREIAMKVSVPVCSKWVEAMCVVVDSFQRKISGNLIHNIELQRCGLERLCPQLGDAVSETKVNKDSALLLLVRNSDIPKIPAAVKMLEKAMNEARTVAEAMHVVPVESHAFMKDAWHLSENAPRFGKRTVSVAAATKLAFAMTPDRALARACAERMRTSLPKVLADMLAAIAAGTALTTPTKTGKRSKPTLEDSLQAAVQGTGDGQEDDDQDESAGASGGAAASGSGKGAKRARTTLA